MNRLFFTIIIGAAILIHFGVAKPYTLNFSKSPDETNNAVLGYIGVWQYTNTAYGTNWHVFGSVIAGVTNLAIPTTVPTLTYLAVETQGTNYLLSSPTNLTFYDTNALAGIYTNNPTPPRPPGTNSLSQ
jgi:hypothetical protein